MAQAGRGGRDEVGGGGAGAVVREGGRSDGSAEVREQEEGVAMAEGGAAVQLQGQTRGAGAGGAQQG